VSVVIGIPGKFMSYLEGSSLLQSPTDPLDVACRDVLRSSIVRRHGKGSYVLAVFPSPEVAGVVADYADACIEANRDEPDFAEVRSARLVLARLARHGVHPV
jgi:hypothetical protein